MSMNCMLKSGYDDKFHVMYFTIVFKTVIIKSFLLYFLSFLLLAFPESSQSLCLSEDSPFLDPYERSWGSGIRIGAEG